MPRKPRVEFEGAIYHIMSRGNHQEAIYRDDKDCEIFLDTLDEACGRAGWRIHAFILMGNHYHLLLETPEPNLVAGMKWLQGTYTQRFNSRHKLWGHLLQGRYKALLVDGSGGDYFLTVSNYIHLNPARVKGFDPHKAKLSDFRWSSFPMYSRPVKRPEWLCVDRTLGCLGLEDTKSGRRKFRDYLNDRAREVGENDSPKDFDANWAKIRRGWCLGTDQFKADMLERIDELSGNRESFSGREVKLHDERQAEDFFQQGLVVLGIDEASLLAMPKGSDEKALLAWLIRRHTVVPNIWIADRLKMGRADCLSRYPKRIDETEDKALAKMREELRIITILRD
ncbi:transposase [Pontiella sp.]|uniref:transposase n=1 Tax=Pontiella sp. TaxID=2837462 RepID=UPI003564D05F